MVEKKKERIELNEKNVGDDRENVKRMKTKCEKN